APIHYVEGGRAMDELNVRELVVGAAVIDVHERASKDRDMALQVEDIRRWESRHGRLPDRVAVLMYSGWDSKAVDDPTRFVGIDSAGATHFPTFSPEAVAFLLHERNIVGIGIDTLSFDQIAPGHSARTHKTLLSANKWGIECIAHLNDIPASGATIYAGALRV